MLIETVSKSVFVSSPKFPKILFESKMLGCVIEDQVNYAIHNLGDDNSPNSPREPTGLRRALRRHPRGTAVATVIRGIGGGGVDISL